MTSERATGWVNWSYEPGRLKLSTGIDLVHQLWLLTLDDRLGVAPPCKEGTTVGRVLDVGTGTGIWALNFGDEHPEADVGVSIGSLLPTLRDSFAAS